MAKKLSPFEQVEDIDGVFSAKTDKLRCIALVLKDGSICLFSPVSELNEEAMKSVSAIGEVRFLLAPNHYHNKGLQEYAEAFPDAVLCAPEAAISRLENITGLKFASLEELSRLLPKNADFVFPDGLKTGEAWLRIQTGEFVAWIVVDAFCGLDAGASPGLLKTFPSFGVADKEVYKTWVLQQIEDDDPKVLLPCHGPVVRSGNLSSELRVLVESTF